MSVQNAQIDKPYALRLQYAVMLAIQRASQILGSQAKLAKTLQVSPMAVSQWKGRIPAERVLQIYRVTSGKVTPHEMRPDLYPDAFYRPQL